MGTFNYTYEQQVTYYYDKLKTAKSSGQAWAMYYKLLRVTNYHQISDEQLAKHKAWLEGVAEKLATTYGSTKKKSTKKSAKPTAKAVVVKSQPKVEPKVSKNGRANNSSRIEAVIANLNNGVESINAAIDILKEMK